MTGAEIGNLIGTVGFPIVAVIFVALFTKNRVEGAEKAAERREEAALQREAKFAESAYQRENRLGERINHLEDSIRSELVTVINRATDAMESVTVAVNDLKQETSKRFKHTGA